MSPLRKIIQALGFNQFRLNSGNEEKRNGIMQYAQTYGFEITAMVPTKCHVTDSNRRTIEAKQKHGHVFDFDD